MERTHNVGGKAYQVPKEMKRMGLAILRVSETRWTGSGMVQLASRETVLYSGLADYNAPHEKGVALILSKEAKKSLKEWKPIPERIVTARFDSKCQNTTIIHESMHQQMMRRRKRRRTSIASFRPHSVIGSREISPWLWEI